MRVEFHKYNELFFGRQDYFDRCFDKHKSIWTDHLTSHAKIEEYHEYYKLVSKVNTEGLKVLLEEFKKEKDIIKEYTVEIVLLERMLAIKKG